MLLGLRTAMYPVTDLAKAKAWYSKVVGSDPYFDEPFYVGFSVGGFELGLLPDGGVPGSAGVLAYWGTANIEEEMKRLTSLGGITHDAVNDVGGGIKVATVKDPFGNLFGVIENPHFNLKEVR